jgi:hypothetical protein
MSPQTCRKEKRRIQGNRSAAAAAAESSGEVALLVGDPPAAVGGLIEKSHAEAHRNPSPPVRKKTQRQPIRSMMKLVIGLMATAPRPEPALTGRTRANRSRGGNHSATALPEPGEAAAFPHAQKKAADAQAEDRVDGADREVGGGPHHDHEGVADPCPEPVHDPPPPAYIKP